MTQEEKLEFCRQVTASLGAFLVDAEDAFWDELDLPEDVGSDEVDAISQGGALLYAVRSFHASGGSKEEWVKFCETIYDELDFGQTPVNSVSGGEA